MLAPLIVLAVLSLAGGFLFNVPAILGNMFPVAEGPENISLTVISVIAGLLGIGISYYMYVVNKALPDRVAASLGGLYTAVHNKYFVDEIYDATVVNPVITGSRSVLWHGMDQGLIDGLVNGVGTQSKGVGGWLRLLQSGNIRSYATWVALGSVALLIVMVLAGGVVR
jgi:NADH-quinone oxidoreductase subunit L